MGRSQAVQTAQVGAAPFFAGKNKIINGDFSIWQRGTSFSTGSSAHVYTADRWLSYFYGTNTSSVSQQTFTPGTAPVAGYEGQFFGRFSSTSTANFISYRVEDVRTLANQVSTLSFWVKSNSNQTVTVEVNQNFGSGGSAVANALNTTQAITQSWTRYSFTFTPPSLSSKTIGTSSYVVISISGAINNAIDLWGVQLEAGSVATPFTTATGTLQGELALAQRYYQAHSRSGQWMMGMASSTSAADSGIAFIVEMRGAPTVTLATAGNSAGTISYLTSTASYPATIGTLSALQITKNGFQLSGTGFTSAFTAGNAAMLYANGTTTVYTASAEL